MKVKNLDAIFEFSLTGLGCRSESEKFGCILEFSLTGPRLKNLDALFEFSLTGLRYRNESEKFGRNF